MVYFLEEDQLGSKFGFGQLSWILEFMASFQKVVSSEDIEQNTIWWLKSYLIC